MRKTRRSLDTQSQSMVSRRRGAGRDRPGTAGRRRQRDVLCDVMLSASQCDTWLTLEELAMLTHYPQASISAQLRHLRKKEFGGYEVAKRQRASGRMLRGEDFGTVWEYRLQRGVKEVSGGQPPAEDSTNRASAKSESRVKKSKACTN